MVGKRPGSTCAFGGYLGSAEYARIFVRLDNPTTSTIRVTAYNTEPSTTKRAAFAAYAGGTPPATDAEVAGCQRGVVSFCPVSSVPCGHSYAGFVTGVVVPPSGSAILMLASYTQASSSSTTYPVEHDVKLEVRTDVVE